MDRSFVAYPSQSQQQQQQQASRRPKNDSFRPALRFPTDPHKPGSLPQKIQHIVAPAAPAAILLQSRRKPWEVDSTRLDDLVASTASLRKVIVVLGDAPTSALEPIVTSSYLSGCLVIVIASSDCDFSIPPQKCVPAVRVLRLRPQPAARPAPQKQSSSQHQRAGSEAAAESQPHLSASRLNAVLNWAERVGSAWRANPVGQTMFATLQEGEGPADGIGHGGKHWKWRSKTKLNETTYDLSDGDGSLVPWAARFALNSRSNTSSLASGGSSNTSSIFIVETPTSDTERPSFSSSSNGKFVRNAMSTSNLATGDRDRSFDHALAVTRRQGTSHAGHRSVPPPAKDLTPPAAAQKRRFSLISFARGKMTPDIPPLSKKAMRPSFDALINFLPPSSATGVDGVLGRGAIATNHAVASHNKLLLKQTILVTTAAQRFLVPVAHRGSGRSPGEGRFGGVTRGRASEGGSGMNGGGGEDRQAKKRWSVAMIGSLFGVGDPVPSAKALGKRSALPTPPVSRPSSSEESGGKRPSLGGRMVSSVSAMSASTQGPYPLPKLVHVLPFGPGHASTPAGPGSARLVRNLEAFLLSWSFGGPKFAEEGDDSGAEGSATFSSNASGKRTVRPFLLDLAGITDVLKAQLPDGDVEWSLADLILSGALDDEFPCTGGSPASTPSVPTPDVVVTRASSDARSPTGSNFPRTASGSKPKFGNDGLTLDSTPGPMEESWAARRAWLSGVGDLAIYPMAEGLGLTASSPTTTSGSGPSLRPTSTSTSVSERSRTRSLGGAPPARPRVSIGGVSSSTSSPVASPQLQAPPPPVPSKIFAPTSSAPSTPAKSRTRINSHGRSQSSSAPPVPPLPPSPQETFGSAFGSPPPPSTFSGRSNFPSEQPRYARNPVPRPPQQSALDSEDRPARYYSVSDHGHGSPAASRSPPSQSSGADLRRGKSGTASSAVSPSMSATPIAAAFSRMRDQDEFGSAPPPPTSWNGTWGSATSSPSYQLSSPSASLPSRSSIKNSDYASQISHGRNPPTRGMTVPQSGGSWDNDSSDVASPHPSVLRKKSIDDRDRRYGANTPPAPHPAFTSSPKYPGAGRRPSEDKQPYFNGYEIAPPPLPLPTPTPPRPTRAAPPSAGGKLERNRSTSSPLRNGVSAEGLNNHRPRPGTGGSVIDKRLPITPPDSASSSEVSNDMDGRTSDREEKRRWWASPTKVSARLI